MDLNTINKYKINSLDVQILLVYIAKNMNRKVFKYFYVLLNI
jgi:hypothetical protein